MQALLLTGLELSYFVQFCLLAAGFVHHDDTTDTTATTRKTTKTKILLRADEIQGGDMRRGSLANHESDDLILHGFLRRRERRVVVVRDSGTPSPPRRVFR